MGGKRKGLCLKYFILNPTKDDPYGEASRKALKAYANAIRDENPDLFYDLFNWEETCRRNIAKEKP